MKTILTLLAAGLVTLAAFQSQQTTPNHADRSLIQNQVLNTETIGEYDFSDFTPGEFDKVQLDIVAERLEYPHTLTCSLEDHLFFYNMTREMNLQHNFICTPNCIWTNEDLISLTEETSESEQIAAVDELERIEYHQDTPSGVETEDTWTVSMEEHTVVEDLQEVEEVRKWKKGCTFGGKVYDCLLPARQIETVKVIAVLAEESEVGEKTEDQVAENQFFAPIDVDVKVYPNPARSQATFEIKNYPDSPYSLELMNMTGQVVQAYANLSQGKHTISRDNLAGGLYVYRVTGNNNTFFAQGRLVFQ